MPNPPGPPFYRLHLSGKGSAPVSISGIQNESYDTGFDAGVVSVSLSGTVGALSLLSGNLAWGTTNNPPDKTLTLEGVGGNMTAGRLAFVGGEASSFQITTRNGDALPTPHNCGTDGDFHFAFDNDTTFTVTFQTLFVDESEQTMSVEVYSADGTLVDTLAASATYTADFELIVSQQPGVLMLWSARDLADGTIGNLNVAMTDILNNEADMINIDGPGYSRSASGFTDLALARAINLVDNGGRLENFNANFAANLVGALFVYYDPGTVTSGKVGHLATVGVLFNNSLDFGVRNDGGGPYWYVGRSAACAVVGVGATGAAGWKTVAFRATGNGAMSVYISDVGGVFGAVATFTTPSTPWTPNAFLSLRPGGGCGYLYQVIQPRLAAIVGFSTSPSAANLEAIHDAVV